MPHEFDPGSYADPFKTLCSEYPGVSVYPSNAFRTEWGPIFYRGRLDGSARILGIGQDPAQHETIARRILVGSAGQRVQGFLLKLGLTRSYVLINAYLYCAYNQGKAGKYNLKPGVVEYRNRWMDSLLDGGSIRAVVAFGEAAKAAWQAWAAAHPDRAQDITFVGVYHPTWPSHAAQNNMTKKQAITKMLQNWNKALAILSPAITAPDVSGEPAPYGDAFKPEELPDIPEFDLPAGFPEWMHGSETWADRPTKAVKYDKRATIVVTVPKKYRQ